MKPALIPESEDFLYWDPETIRGYPHSPGGEREVNDVPPSERQQDTLWRTLSRHGLASLALGFGAGVFASAALSLAVLLLSAG